MSEYIYNDDDLYKKTRYVTEFTAEEREEFEKQVNELGIRIGLQCRGYRAGCPAHLVDFAVNPPTITKQLTSHFCGNLVREDHYSLKYAYDENGEPTILKRVTLCGCCGHEELQVGLSLNEIQKQARKDIKAALEDMAELIVLLGDEYHKLKTILTLHNDPDRDTAVRLFDQNMDGRMFLEAIRVLGSDAWKDTFREEGEHELDYEIKFKNGTIAMLDTTLKYLSGKHSEGSMETDHFEECAAVALFAKNRIINGGKTDDEWLDDTTEMAVYSFLKPFGYKFVAPWWEALKASVEEEQRIARLREELS
jgi:hypothetical protein